MEKIPWPDIQGIYLTGELTEFGRRFIGQGQFCAGSNPAFSTNKNNNIMNSNIQVPELTDESKMLFGQHIGKRLIDVPASYLMWLRAQGWFMRSTDSYYTALRNYIEENKDVIQKEFNQSVYKKP